MSEKSETTIPDPDCWACWIVARPMGNMGRDRMIVCASCGNKRCPKASDHRLICTGSNATGQPGSIYA